MLNINALKPADILLSTGSAFEAVVDLQGVPKGTWTATPIN